jgi:hypothetical protein
MSRSKSRAHRRVAVVAAACLSLLAGTLGAAAHPTTAIAPKNVVLRLADLPAGFKVSKANGVTNSDMAIKTRLKKKAFDSHGRITGFEENFDHATARSGAITVSSNAYVYRTSAGAHWDYTQALKADLKAAKRTTAPRVGDESTGMVLPVKSGKRSLTFYLIVFHRNRVDATVVVGGFTGSVSMSDAAKYAAIVDTRIRSGR